MFAALSDVHSSLVDKVAVASGGTYAVLQKRQTGRGGSEYGIAALT